MRDFSKLIRSIFKFSGLFLGSVACDSPNHPTLEVLDSTSHLSFFMERRVGQDLLAPYFLEDRVVFEVQGPSPDRVTHVNIEAECRQQEGDRSFRIETSLDVGVFPLHALLSLEDLGEQTGSALTTSAYQCVFAFVGRTEKGFSRSVQNVKVEIPTRPRGGVSIHHREDTPEQLLHQQVLTSSDFNDYHVTVFHTVKEANVTLKCSDFQKTSVFDPQKNSKENLASFFDLDDEYEVLVENPSQKCQVLYGKSGEAHWAWSRPFHLIFEQPRPCLTFEQPRPRLTFEQPRSRLTGVPVIGGPIVSPKVEIPQIPRSSIFKLERRVSQNQPSTSYLLEDRVSLRNPDEHQQDPIQSVQINGTCRMSNADQSATGQTLEISKNFNRADFPLHAIFSLEQIGFLSSIDVSTEGHFQCDLELAGVMQSGATLIPEEIQVRVPFRSGGGLVISNRASLTEALRQNQDRASMLHITDLELQNYRVTVLHPLSQGHVTLKCLSFQDSVGFISRQNAVETLASLFNFQSHYDKLMENPLQTCRVTYGRPEDSHWAWSDPFEVLFTKAFNERLSLEVMFKMDRLEDRSPDRSYSLEDRVMFVHREHQDQPHDQISSVQISGNCRGQKFDNPFEINKTFSGNVVPLNAVVSLGKMQFHPQAVAVPTREFPEQLAYMSDQDYQCVLTAIGMSTTGMTTTPYQIEVEVPARPRGGISIHPRMAENRYLLNDREGFTESDFQDYHVTVFHPIQQAPLTLKCSDFETSITFDTDQNSKRRLASLFPLENHYEVLMEHPLQMCHIIYGKFGETHWAWSRPFQVLFEKAFDDAFSLTVDVDMYPNYRDFYIFQIATVRIHNPLSRQPLFVYFDREAVKGLNVNVNFNQNRDYSSTSHDWWSGKRGAYVESSIEHNRAARDGTSDTFLLTRDLEDTDKELLTVRLDPNSYRDHHFFVRLPKRNRDFREDGLSAFPFNTSWFNSRNDWLRILSIVLYNPQNSGFMNFYLSNEKGHSFKPIFRGFENSGFVQICNQRHCDAYRRKKWGVL